MKNKRLSIPTPIFLVVLIFFAWSVYFHAEKEEVALPEKSVPIRLYSNQAGDNLQKTFVDVLRSAKESIVCIIYSLTDDEIIQALKSSAERGVKVLVICDPVATQDVGFKLGEKVQLVARRQKGLMHNKLLAIDHKQAWLGSANFTRDSLLLHANLVLGIDSPELAKAIEDKAEQLRLKKVRDIKPLSLKSGEQSLDLSFLPDDSAALKRLSSLIRGAQKSVKVAMFTFTHPELIQAVVDAHKKGLEVEVVIDHDSSRKTSSKAYGRFRREKVPTFISKRTGLLHEKIAIIDDTTLVCGSANWTKAAFTSNDENLCILSNLTTEQQEKLSRFWQTTLVESSK